VTALGDPRREGRRREGEGELEGKNQTTKGGGGGLRRENKGDSPVAEASIGGEGTKRGEESV